jgi:hypothetical protein
MLPECGGRRGLAAWLRPGGARGSGVPAWLRRGGRGWGRAASGVGATGCVGTDLGFGEFVVYIPWLFPRLRVEIHKVEGLLCKIVMHKSPTGV